MLSDAVIVRLEQLIHGAQSSLPADAKAFVDTVNRIMDSQSLRLELADGALGRLQLRRASGKSDAIQIGVANTRSTRSFKSATINIVRVDHVGRSASREAT